MRLSRRSTRRLLAGVCLLVAVTAAGTAAAAVRPLPSLLLTLSAMPSGFRVWKPAQFVDDDAYNHRLVLSAGPYKAGIVSFRRKTLRVDNSLDYIDINITMFRDETRAHTAFDRLLREQALSPFGVGRIGAERAGFWVRGTQVFRNRLVNVTTLTIYWRYKSFVFVMTGTYLTKSANEGLPGAQSLLALARAQQAKLAGVVG